MSVVQFAPPKFVPSGARMVPASVWVVIDEDGRPSYCAPWPEACHAHINDAISEHDIAEARHWVVREFVVKGDQK
jgi:hypothetical protein